VEQRVSPRRSGTLSAGERQRRKLDRFDHDLLAFVLSWAPYGGPPADECFVEFGMSPGRVHERCLQVVCTARPGDFGDGDWALLIRASQLLLGPTQHTPQRVVRDPTIAVHRRRPAPKINEFGLA
jgi:hypothetical protein